MDFIKLIVIGVILGVANVIPGVSGGTLAVVFNIYDRLISVITLNVKKIFSEWKFILPLVVGMGLGIILFSKAITFLFEHYPVQTNWFFIGIILGSIPMIIKRLLVASKNSAKGSKKKVVPVSAIVCGVVALGIMAIMTYVNVAESGAPIQTELTPVLAVKLFIGLACATIAMIIPGISGSFLMLVVGIYSTIIAAISDFNIPLLIPAVIGGAVGLLGGAKLVRFLMAKVPAQTYGAIMGLVLGSILVIFPGFGGFATLATSLLAAAVGFVVSFFAGREKIES
jgi:putative membrane protein